MNFYMYTVSWMLNSISYIHEDDDFRFSFALDWMLKSVLMFMWFLVVLVVDMIVNLFFFYLSVLWMCILIWTCIGFEP